MPDFEKPEDWSKRPHVVAVVDQSGSMLASRTTTISTLNEYFDGLKGKLPDEARVTVVAFDSDYTVVRLVKIFDQAPLGTLRKITLEDYIPSGYTPLNDAIGKTISGLDTTLVAEPAPVFFTILTDGGENSSREFKLETVRALIQQRTAQGWTFNFMGVDIEAYAASSSFGIHAGNTVALKRGKLDKLGATLSGSTSMRYGLFADAGGDMKTYGARSAATASFSAAEKADLETDDPVPPIPRKK